MGNNGAKIFGMEKAAVPLMDSAEFVLKQVTQLGPLV